MLPVITVNIRVGHPRNSDQKLYNLHQLAPSQTQRHNIVYTTNKHADKELLGTDTAYILPKRLRRVRSGWSAVRNLSCSMSNKMSNGFKTCILQCNILQNIVFKLSMNGPCHGWERLVCGISARRAGFSPRTVYVRHAVDKEVRKRVSCKNFGASLSVEFQKLHNYNYYNYNYSSSSS